MYDTASLSASITSRLFVATVLLGASTVAGLTAIRPRLDIAQEETNLVLNFEGQLQKATEVLGPFTNVAGAVSPYRTLQVASQSYWRSVWDGAKTIAGGARSTVAIRADGTLWTWGDNVGNGTFIATNTPQPVQASNTWRAVSAHDQTLAVDATGSLWAWGGNYTGQLGNGTTVPITNTPQPIQPTQTWQAVAAGRDHSMGLHADGTLWTWGRNYFGQLGTGNRISTNTPQSILPSRRWLAVAAGASHSLALRSDGTLWAWGSGLHGQLGVGNNSDFSEPQIVEINMRWQAIAAAGGHNLALRSDGTLWTWGLNSSGQVGNGTFVSTNTPQPIQINVTWQGIAAGYYHSMALRKDGTLWTWGFNADGQLGNGTTDNANTPQPIQTNVTWQAIAAGGSGCPCHTVALRADGTLWAWGNNAYGQLGNGTLITTNTPQPVLGGANWGTPR